ncbi:MAG: hypothetical protein SGI83_00970 [Bacteroidota bacterium]|nr:hypothetical protein [Bacteroidota bacterium]
MMKSSNKLFILFLSLMVFLNSGVKAQTTLDSAMNTALNFFKTYDSIPYLTFDVRYTHFSDTAYSDFSYEVMKGSYTMSGRKAKYSMGDVDYLQNDSFLVAVYHKDEQIVVSDPPVQNAGSYLPMRDMLDSLLQAYSTDYNIWVKSTSTDTETDSIGYIRLIRKLNNTEAAYNRYIIEFDIARNVITKVEFEYTQPGSNLSVEQEPNEGQRLLKNTDRRKTLCIEFLNYRFDNFSDNIYSENNIIWEEDGEYKPVEKYKNYKVYNAKN